VGARAYVLWNRTARRVHNQSRRLALGPFQGEGKRRGPAGSLPFLSSCTLSMTNKLMLIFALIQIEAKIGTLRDPTTNRRVQLPVLTETSKVILASPKASTGTLED
jgi:hypothetical protein